MPIRLNESPSEKEGKSPPSPACLPHPPASMKVPPKRKGNQESDCNVMPAAVRLNESPSEKEGK